MLKGSIILILSLLAGFKSFGTDRPPQFVNLAFDGSKSHSMWKRTLEFAKQENIKFTYFISGVYFLSNSDRTQYKGPRRSAGRSDIGFGGDDNDVKKRNAWVETALNNGHEIASHANGHFNGSSWSEQEWTSEFNQFHTILERSTSVYGGMSDPKNWLYYIQDNIIGFRAPLLGHNQSMLKSLQKKRYYYDTSRVKKASYWPQNENGVWNFPLASIRVAGKKTLSMDYNMYVAQSKGKRGHESNFKRWENEVVESYLAYFKNNYLGNRAPIDIGHHFSLWNGGIYWSALKRFAREVCHLPEVVCGTYTDLVNFLDSKSTEDLKNYQNGSFRKMRNFKLPEKLIRISQSHNDFNIDLTPEEIAQLQKNFCPPEAHLDDGLLEDSADDNGVYTETKDAK